MGGREGRQMRVLYQNSGTTWSYKHAHTNIQIITKINHDPNIKYLVYTRKGRFVFSPDQILDLPKKLLALRMDDL